MFMDEIHKSFMRGINPLGWTSLLKNISLVTPYYYGHLINCSNNSFLCA